jgi:adenosylcobinamide hydrolase
MPAVRVWHFDTPQMCIASAAVGGGIGMRSWLLNAQVDPDFARTDLDTYVRELARAHGVAGEGVAMLTAASVSDGTEAFEAGIAVTATVGLSIPTWAADADGAISPWRPGTINVVAVLPVALTRAALVNAVMTVTEAKAQALFEAGVPGTGTASDAVCIVCPPDGDAEAFGGPRSRLGAPLARATHAAIAKGIAR